MNLTIEQQRKLTEFLGECWHEWEYCSGWNGVETEHWFRCKKCNKEVSASRVRADSPPIQSSLDFTDWRVVMRVWETANKRGLQPSLEHFAATARCVVKKFNEQPYASYSSCPKEAICLAVLAYLESEE